MLSNFDPLCVAAGAEVERIDREHGQVCSFLNFMTAADFAPIAWRPADADAASAWAAFKARGAVNPDILPRVLATSDTTLEIATADVDGDGRPERVYRATLRDRIHFCSPDNHAQARHAIFFGPADSPRMRRLGRHNIGDFADLISYRGATYLVQEDSFGMTFYRASGGDPDDGAVDLTKICSVSNGSAEKITF